MSDGRYNFITKFTFERLVWGKKISKSLEPVYGKGIKYLIRIKF
jgi:hypothetical protein